MEGPIQNGFDAGQTIPMFSDFVTHNLDPKKRLNVPANWREKVGTPDRVFVMQGFDDEPCLYCFPMRVMTERLDFVRKSKVSDITYREFTRALGETSTELNWDSQGRIRIPDNLLGYAGLVGPVFMLGATDRFELWLPERRKSYKQAQDSKLSSGALARKLGF